MMQVDHPCAEIYSHGWSTGFSSQGREGPSGGGAVARGPAGVASTLKTAGGLLVLAPQRPPTTTRRRGSSGCRGSDPLPAPLRAARPPLRRDARAAGSFSRRGRTRGRSSSGGFHRESLQGALVAAPFWATTLPGHGRRPLRRLDFLPAPLRDLVIAGSGAARRRHDWAGFGRAKLEVRGEVGNTLRR
jgi:hypothetical protein